MSACVECGTLGNLHARLCSRQELETKRHALTLCVEFATQETERADRAEQRAEEYRQAFLQAMEETP